MKQETYRATGLLWFSALLLALSVGIFRLSVESTPVLPASTSNVSDFNELEPSEEPPDPPPPGAPATDFAPFVATAYSVNGTTASGVRVNTGIVAADPRVLPIGSVIEIEAGDHSGIYTVLDTGGFIKGKRIDIYMPSFDQALSFGRRAVKVRVLRHGWKIDSANLG
jgi:3D (Asp-Asp-Asp) domain-containing protein